MNKGIANTIMYHLEKSQSDTSILQRELEAVLRDTYEYGVELYRMEGDKLDEDFNGSPISISRTNHRRPSTRAERRKANFAHKGKDAAKRGSYAKWHKWEEGKFYNFFHEDEVVKYRSAKHGHFEDDTPSMKDVMNEVDKSLRLEERMHKEHLLEDLSHQKWELIRAISKIQEEIDRLHEQEIALANEIDNLPY